MTEPVLPNMAAGNRSHIRIPDRPSTDQTTGPERLSVEHQRRSFATHSKNTAHTNDSERHQHTGRRGRADSSEPGDHSNHGTHDPVAAARLTEHDNR
jgi:hypothetical protein